jgi:hypothetical protein
MPTKAERAARAVRQERVSKAVWGLVFLTFGALLIMEDRGDIALGEPTKYPARHVVDGDEETRWSSAFKENAWVTIDLGHRVHVRRVRLLWEKAFATRYQIQVSDDASAWTTAYEVKDGDGGTDELDVDAKGRYVRMEGLERSTPWGYSLFEFEVYGADVDQPDAAARLLSGGKATSASSFERIPAALNYWLLFWPVLLVACGLPLLVAPKDDGEQVFGLVLTAVGAFLQLQRLGHIPWTLAQSWPLLLVIAGVLLVGQAFRQKDDPAGPSSGCGGPPWRGGS